MEQIKWDLIASNRAIAGQCKSIAPWLIDDEEHVQCQVEKGHDGRHGGNGWTWD